MNQDTENEFYFHMILWISTCHYQHINNFLLPQFNLTNEAACFIFPAGSWLGPGLRPQMGRQLQGAGRTGYPLRRDPGAIRRLGGPRQEEEQD